LIQAGTGAGAKKKLQNQTCNCSSHRIGVSRDVFIGGLNRKKQARVPLEMYAI
jgi:hypothetical protein